MRMRRRADGDAGPGTGGLTAWQLLPFGCLLLASLSSAAFETAHMHLPTDFAGAARYLPVDGLGGSTRGEFRFGDYSGTFTRTESRLAIFEPLYENQRAGSTFTVSGARIPEPVSGVCRARKQSVQVGIVTLDPERMTYSCEFRQSAVPLEATFLLGQPRPDTARSALLAQARRVGEARFGAVAITIRSEHRYQGTPLESDTPVGYLLEREGRLVAAVELTDVNPGVYLSPNIGENLEAAVVLAVLPLAVLWDPDESMLDDEFD